MYSRHACIVAFEISRVIVVIDIIYTATTTAVSTAWAAVDISKTYLEIICINRLQKKEKKRESSLEKKVEIFINFGLVLILLFN